MTLRSSISFLAAAKAPPMGVSPLPERSDQVAAGRAQAQVDPDLAITEGDHGDVDLRAQIVLVAERLEHLAHRLVQRLDLAVTLMLPLTSASTITGRGRALETVKSFNSVIGPSAPGSGGGGELGGGAAARGGCPRRARLTMSSWYLANPMGQAPSVQAALRSARWRIEKRLRLRYTVITLPSLAHTTSTPSNRERSIPCSPQRRTSRQPRM